MNLGVTNCKNLIFIGSVGSSSEEINIGDIVIPKSSICGDGEELDAYIVGVFEPKEEFFGKVIVIIHRTNDNDYKLVVAPEDKDYTDKQIKALTEFQEQYLESYIVRK